MNRAGMVSAPSTRAIVTLPPSSGSRSASSASLRNWSVSSSRRMPAMRQRRLAGPHPRPAADERLGRDGVVRRAKGPLAQQRCAPVEQPGDRVDAAHLDRLVVLERRLEARRAAQEERLADPRRAAQREVVAPCQRDLQAAARQRLPLDLGQVRAADRVAALRQSRRLGDGQVAHARQVTDRLAQRGGAVHPQAGHRRRLAGRRRRDDQRRHARRERGGRQRHEAGHRAQERRRARARRPARYSRSRSTQRSWPEAARIPTAIGRS